MCGIGSTLMRSRSHSALHGLQRRPLASRTPVHALGGKSYSCALLVNQQEALEVFEVCTYNNVNNT